MKIFSPILKGTTTVAQGTTNLSGSFTGSLLGTAATASYADNFTVGGTLTAQTINVQIITSSIEFVTGSTRNGSSTANTHQFTGSVLMTGSLSVTGSAAFSSDVTTGGKILISDGGNATIPCLKIGSATTGISQNVSEQLNFITNSTTKMIISSSGNIGIGTTTPQSLSTNTFKFIDISNIGSSQTAGLTMHAQTGGQEFSIHHTNGVYIDVVGHSTATNNFIQFRVASANSTYTSYVDAMRITSAGNVGIGTTSPVSNDSNSRTFQLGNRLVVQNVIGTQFLIGTNAYYDGTWKYIAAEKYQAIRGTGESGHISFHLASAGTAGGTITNMDGSDIKMIIKESGNVGIGTTSPGEKLHIYGGGLGPEVRLEGTFGSFYIRVYNDNFNIYTPQGRNAISIANNGNVYNYSNTTSWQTTSDIRVKENINTIENALNVITSLNPVSFNYKQEFAEKNNWDDTMKLNNIGFIAQEFENVFPKYVYTKEYTLGDTPIEDFKSIDTGHLVPYLVKAIQELSAKNTSLEERLTALENN